MQRCTAGMPHLHSQQVVLCSTTRHCTHTHHTLATAHQGEPVLGTAESGQVGMAARDRVEELHVTVQTMQPLMLQAMAFNSVCSYHPFVAVAHNWLFPVLTCTVARSVHLSAY